MALSTAMMSTTMSNSTRENPLDNCTKLFFLNKTLTSQKPLKTHQEM